MAMAREQDHFGACAALHTGNKFLGHSSVLRGVTLGDLNPSISSERYSRVGVLSQSMIPQLQCLGNNTNDLPAALPSAVFLFGVCGLPAEGCSRADAEMALRLPFLVRDLRVEKDIAECADR